MPKPAKKRDVVVTIKHHRADPEQEARFRAILLEVIREIAKVSIMRWKENKCHKKTI